MLVAFVDVDSSLSWLCGRGRVVVVVVVVVDVVVVVVSGHVRRWLPVGAKVCVGLDNTTHNYLPSGHYHYS